MALPKSLFPAQSGKSNNLDIIRFLLAVSVLFCHCFVLYYGTEMTVEPLFVASGGQMSIGTFAVNFFFVISGFLILQSWHYSENFWIYLRKRILRIYPGFIVVSLLCIFIFGPLGTSDFYMPLGYWKIYYHSIDYAAIVGQLMVLGEPIVPWCFKYVPIADAINGSLWTIKYEFICYLLVPFLGWMRMYRKPWLIFPLFLVIFGYYAAQTFDPTIDLWHWKEYKVIGKPDFFPRFLTYFLTGMIFYLFKDKLPRSKWLFGCALMCIVSTIFLGNGLAVAQTICGSYVLFYLAFVQSYTMKNFSRSGDYSYGVYLYAWPVQQLIIVYLEKYLNVGLLFLLALMITLLLANLSWNLVEKPFLKLKEISPEKSGAVQRRFLKWIIH